MAATPAATPIYWEAKGKLRRNGRVATPQRVQCGDETLTPEIGSRSGSRRSKSRSRSPEVEITKAEVEDPRVEIEAPRVEVEVPGV